MPHSAPTFLTEVPPGLAFEASGPIEFAGNSVYVASGDLPTTVVCSFEDSTLAIGMIFDGEGPNSDLDALRREIRDGEVRMCSSHDFDIGVGLSPAMNRVRSVVIKNFDPKSPDRLGRLRDALGSFTAAMLQRGEPMTPAVAATIKLVHGLIPTIAVRLIERGHTDSTD